MERSGKMESTNSPFYSVLAWAAIDGRAIYNQLVNCTHSVKKWEMVPAKIGENTQQGKIDFFYRSLCKRAGEIGEQCL